MPCLAVAGTTLAMLAAPSSWTSPAAQGALAWGEGWHLQPRELGGWCGQSKGRAATPPKGQRQSPEAAGMGGQPWLLCQGPLRLAAAGAGPCTDPSTTPGPGLGGGRHRPALSWLKLGSAHPSGGAVLCLGQAAPRAPVQDEGGNWAGRADGRQESRARACGRSAGQRAACDQDTPPTPPPFPGPAGRVWGRHVFPYNAPVSAGGGGGWAQPEQGVTASTKSWGREHQGGKGCRQAARALPSARSSRTVGTEVQAGAEQG